MPRTGRILTTCLTVAVFILSLWACPGCQSPQRRVAAPPETVETNRPPAPEPRPLPPVPTGYGPAKITILPLSDLVAIGQGETRLEVFVEVLDAFSSPIKTPAVLRVELYEYTPRSPQPKGRRVAIWPDIDLTHPAENNRHWRDVLRAYYFEFDPLQVDRDRTYVLEVTCLCPGGKRLSAEYAILADS